MAAAVCLSSSLENVDVLVLAENGSLQLNVLQNAIFVASVFGL